ncbi:MAG: hypothetical protein H7336_01830 [Bacteriovorax sp.]|nr:hypothetical protein [Bacteriovorax sp.]
MLKLFISFAFYFATTVASNAALEYSKIESPGCPENAYCQKATGIVRQQWLDELEKFGKNKISESDFNKILQNSNGVPIANWAAEEAGVLPRIIMWDSPCKQHKNEASKFYISEVFRKNLLSSELKELSTLYFSKAVGVDSNKKIFTMTVPRGDTPTFSENGYFYYLREDNGKYYGLRISKEGLIKVSKVEVIKETVKEAVCLKEQVDVFMREAPSPTFYQGYTCKDIWDKTSKSYKPMLFGWSCN